VMSSSSVTSSWDSVVTSGANLFCVTDDVSIFSSWNENYIKKTYPKIPHLTLIAKVSTLQIYFNMSHIFFKLEKLTYVFFVGNLLGIK
jgi:hypothetical protein